MWRRHYVFGFFVRECVLPCVHPSGRASISYKPVDGISPNFGCSCILEATDELVSFWRSRGQGQGHSKVKFCEFLRFVSSSVCLVCFQCCSFTIRWRIKIIIKSKTDHRQCFTIFRVWKSTYLSMNTADASSHIIGVGDGGQGGAVAPQNSGKKYFFGQKSCKIWAFC